MTPGQILRAALDKSYAEHLEKLRATVRNEPDYQLQERAQALADEDAAAEMRELGYNDGYERGLNDGECWTQT